MVKQKTAKLPDSKTLSFLKVARAIKLVVNVYPILSYTCSTSMMRSSPNNKIWRNLPAIMNSKINQLEKTITLRPLDNDTQADKKVGLVRKALVMQPKARILLI